MSKRNPKVPASDREPGGLHRRGFLGAGAVLLLAPWAARAAHHEGAGLPAATKRALGKSPYVYVSPLLASGAESTCHGEVWYGWQKGAVYLVTSRESWKSRAVARGLDRARLWVGDHGKWKGLLGTHQEFRQAPRFDAKASAVRDDAAFRTLMESYVGKYGAPFTQVWKTRMESGYADGSRVLLRYEPVART